MEEKYGKVIHMHRYVSDSFCLTAVQNRAV